MGKDVGIAYHNLSVMLAAGVPLLRSLSTVGESQRRRLRKAFEKISEGTAKGMPLHESMALHGDIFDPVDVMLIGAAEMSGSLPESFGLLSQWHEFSTKMKKRMLSGLMLPICIIHAAAVLIPVPGFAMGGWDVNEYIRSVVVLLLLFFYIPAAVIFVLVRFSPRRGLGRRIVDRASLKIPVLGRAIQKMALGRYAFVFHMMSKAGIPVAECAQKAVDGTSNSIVGGWFAGGVEAARQGRPVIEGFSKKVPLDFLNIWQVGEESGTLDEVTRRLADRHAEEAEFWFEEFGRWAPRAVYFVVTVALAYVVIKGFVGLYSSMLSV